MQDRNFDHELVSSTRFLRKKPDYLAIVSLVVIALVIALFIGHVVVLAYGN